MENNTKQKKQMKEPSQKSSFWKILYKSSLSFWAMAPLLFGVIGLVGIFQVLVTPKMLSSLFRGNFMVDTLIGTLTGAAASGNPVISYMLGGELLAQSVSFYAVSAFILSWVTLSFVHLPAEVAVFGGRFTLYRNILVVVFTIMIAVLTTLTIQVLS